MSQELHRIAEEVAEEKWERQWGFGMHHVSQDVKNQAVKVALVEVEKWFKLLTPAFEAQENKRIREVDTQLDQKVEDTWGQTGDETRQYLVAHILDRHNQLKE